MTKYVNWFDNSNNDPNHAQEVYNMIHDAVVNPSPRAKMWSSFGSGVLVAGLIILILAMMLSAIVAMFS